MWGRRRGGWGDSKLVDPAADGRPADLRQVDCPGDLVKGEATVGEESVEVEAADAGEDVPDKGQRKIGEVGRLKVTAEARA